MQNRLAASEDAANLSRYYLDNSAHLRAWEPVREEGYHSLAAWEARLVDQVRSGALLEKLGFEKEGLAKSYLKINGRWGDHVLTSLRNPDDG